MRNLSQIFIMEVILHPQLQRLLSSETITLKLCDGLIVDNTAYTSFSMTKRYSNSKKHCKSTIIY